MEPFRPGLLAGKTTIITGGGTGLGQQMALRFAGLGARVGVIGRRPDPLQETVNAIVAAGGQAAAAPCDIREPAAVQSALDALEAKLGPANQLINNAGANFLCPAEDLSPGGFDAVVKIVLYGTFHCTRELGRRLIERKQSGEMLSIVTSYATTGSAFVLPSAVAKAGVLAMVRSLAVEWATYGIRVNAVAPGFFPTEGATSRLMAGPEMKEEALRRVPAHRFGEHHELVNMIAYLMSDATPYQTGDLVTVDGGEALFSGQSFSGFAHHDRAQVKSIMAALKPKRS
jgi:NAD(P)-dependent dehydrogenase (short-subunit alcohol dehydrogenase family)